MTWPVLSREWRGESDNKGKRKRIIYILGMKINLLNLLIIINFLYLRYNSILIKIDTRRSILFSNNPFIINFVVYFPMKRYYLSFFILDRISLSLSLCIYIYIYSLKEGRTMGEVYDGIKILRHNITSMLQ